MRKRDYAFLTYLQTGYATATYRMAFKTQRTAYISLRALTTDANAPKDLRGYWTEVHQICSHSIFFHRRC